MIARVGYPTTVDGNVRYAQPVRMAHTKTGAQERNVVPPGNSEPRESNDPGRLTTRVDVMWLDSRSCDRPEPLS
jgi:hypothetical protein